MHATIEKAIEEAIHATTCRVDPPELVQVVDDLKVKHHPIALDIAGLSVLVFPMLGAYSEQSRRDVRPLINCLRSCIRAHLREHNLPPESVHEAIQAIKRASVVVESLARMPP